MTASSAEAERVRRHTASSVNAAIDETTRQCVRRYILESQAVISQRIEELDREFDIERVLQMNASLVALSGIVLSVTVNRRWLLLPATVLGFLFQHATHGWCPPVPVFRRLGVRTRSEIERERFVLKFLRGDFDQIDWPAAKHSPDGLLAAAST